MAEKFQFPTNTTGKNLTAEIYDVIGTAICVTDEHGNFVDVNKSYCELYGYTKAELIGKSFTIVLPESAREIGQQIHNAFIAGAPEMAAEWQVVRRDGTPIDIYAQPSLLIRENGTRCKVTAVTDITEYKRLKGLLRTVEKTETVKV
jgi:two-component system, chemotaxis family, CheB/CheR fusion protein